MNKKELKTVLVSTNTSYRFSNLENDQMAGFLRSKGYSIDLYYAHGRDMEYKLNNLPLEYDLYYFSLSFKNYRQCIELSKIIKMNTQAIIVYGGKFSTRYYDDLFNMTASVDYIIIGDCEYPFQTIIDHIVDGVPTHCSVASINNRKNVEPYHNGKIEYFPAFDYYENDKEKRNIRKEYCIQSKNNVCMGKCVFCTEQKGEPIFKSVQHIVDEIIYVANRFGIKKFFFTDDNLFDPNTNLAKERIKELCLKIQETKLNLVFKCYIKAFSFRDTIEDRELLKLMSNVGFKTIFVGIESGNQEDLDFYNKFTTVDDNYIILNLLNEYGIVPQIGFININPYTTMEKLRKNYDFLTKIEMDNLFMYVCSYMRVYKGTPVYDKMINDGLLITAEWDYFDDQGLYRFIDKQAEEIFDFIKNFMYNRVRNLDYEMDWLLYFYQECIKLNPIAQNFKENLFEIRASQLERIKSFFYILMVEGNVSKAQDNVERFLESFEHDQDDLEKIHKNLVNIYVNAPLYC